MYFNALIDIPYKWKTKIKSGKFFSYYLGTYMCFALYMYSKLFWNNCIYNCFQYLAKKKNKITTYEYTNNSKLISYIIMKKIHATVNKLLIFNLISLNLFQWYFRQFE